MDYIEVVNRAAKLLQAMAYGIPIKIGNHEYAMTENLDVGIVYDKHVSSLTHIECGRFFRLVRDMSEDEYIELVGYIGLNELRMEK